MFRQLGWGEDYPIPLRHRGRGAPRPRWRLFAVIALCVVVVGFLAGLTGTRGGLVALGLAVVLVVLLGAHHASGGGRWVARAVAEYAVVAVLVALLAASFTGHHPTAPPRHSARPTPAAGAEAGRACPDPSLRQASAWLSCVWHRAMDPAPTPPPTTRRHP